MAVIKTIPSQRLIHGNIIETSEVALITEDEYQTKGEECIIVRKVEECTLTLDNRTTDHIVIKALTKVIVKPISGLIDEEYIDVEMNKGACIEFRWANGNWYILSSDGLKQS
jgi:hypothetical protein